MPDEDLGSRKTSISCREEDAQALQRLFDEWYPLVRDTYAGFSKQDAFHFVMLWIEAEWRSGDFKVADFVKGRIEEATSRAST